MVDAALFSANGPKSPSSVTSNVDFDDVCESTSEPTDDEDSQIGDDDGDLVNGRQ